MCCSVLGGDGYSDYITDVTHQSKNALGILNPNGRRRQNPVSIILDASQVFYCIGLYTFFLYKVNSTYFEYKDILYF